MIPKALLTASDARRATDAGVDGLSEAMTLTGTAVVADAAAELLQPSTTRCTTARTIGRPGFEDPDTPYQPTQKGLSACSVQCC